MEQNALFRQTCVAMGVPVSWFQSKVNALARELAQSTACRPSTSRTRTRCSASPTTSAQRGTGAGRAAAAWRGGCESKPAKAAQDIRLGGDVSELAAAYARGDPAS